MYPTLYAGFCFSNFFSIFAIFASRLVTSASSWLKYALPFFVDLALLQSASKFPVFHSFDLIFPFSFCCQNCLPNGVCVSSSATTSGGRTSSQVLPHNHAIMWVQSPTTEKQGLVQRCTSPLTKFSIECVFFHAMIAVELAGSQSALKLRANGPFVRSKKQQKEKGRGDVPTSSCL